MDTDEGNHDLATCPKCGRATEEEEQHGTVLHPDESGDGLAHDGGCDHCCCCNAERERQ